MRRGLVIPVGIAALLALAAFARAKEITDIPGDLFAEAGGLGAPAGDAVPGGQAYFLVVSTRCAADDLRGATDAIRARGGSVLVTAQQTAAIGGGSEELAEELAARDGLAVFRGPVGAGDLKAVGVSCRDAAESLAGTWDRMAESLATTGRPFAERPSAKRGSPMIEDAFEHPGMAAGTTSSMTGNIGVFLILPESTGATDPSTENWTDAMRNQVASEVQTGLAWWTSHAASYGVTVTFNTYWFSGANLHYNNTKYEPINHPYYDECLWIDDIMSGLGYNSGDCYARVNSFNSAEAASLGYGSDKFYTMFIVNSLNDSDGVFADGSYFGYAYQGGPFVMMTYDNDGWGIDQMHLVAAHESGHIFWACDEYYDPGYATCDCTCTGNPWHTSNANCDNGCGMSVDCIMKSDAEVTCTHTRQQIGWSATACGNDTCSTAGTLAVPGTVNGATGGCSANYAGSCGGGSAPDRVFQFATTAGLYYVADLTSSDYDTLLYVRQAPCASGSELGCNDNFNGSNRHSRVAFVAPSNATVYAIVDGAGSASGSFSLSVASCNGCYIDNACYANGALNPSNACQKCNTGATRDAWSNNDGASCNDGLYCNGADTCSGATCHHAGDPCPNGTTCNESTDHCDSGGDDDASDDAGDDASDDAGDDASDDAGDDAGDDDQIIHHGGSNGSSSGTNCGC